MVEFIRKVKGSVNLSENEQLKLCFDIVNLMELINCWDAMVKNMRE